MIQNKIVVGIIPTFNLTNEQNNPYQDRTSFVTMYSDKIRRVGGIPVGLLEEDPMLYTELCDAYLWPGGKKILQSFFPVLDDAIQEKKPLLGICLGAQAIALYFNILEDSKNCSYLSLQEVYYQNKSLIPYLKKVQNDLLHQHSIIKDSNSINNAKHEIYIQKKTLLYEIYQRSIANVVSLHSYEIARTPSSLSISAESEDHVIEAIEYRENDSKILGVQFHPEIEDDTRIFEWLVQEAEKRKGQKLCQKLLK